MTSQRRTRTIERTGRYAVAAAAVVVAASLFVGEVAIARPQPFSLLQAEQSGGAFEPAQRDELSPSQRGGVSLQQATSIAQRAFPGRVVGARTVQMGDRSVHEVRILGEDGRTVRTFRIDAQTGAFL